jgi:Isochorismatase family
VTTEVCVNTTVREANDRGFRCIVLSDCCASYFPDFHDVGLRMIKAQGGIFGSISASAPVVAALSQTGVTPASDDHATEGGNSVRSSSQRKACCSSWPEGQSWKRSPTSLGGRCRDAFFLQEQ